MSQPWLRASIKITKPIVLIDMDGVICDFDKRAKELELQGVKGQSGDPGGATGYDGSKGFTGSRGFEGSGGFSGSQGLAGAPKKNQLFVADGIENTFTLII
jgi:hypothetical protein